MVSNNLIEKIHEVLGETPRRILVTGATGFIGAGIAQAFARAGHDVTSTGRNKYLAPQDTCFVAVDLRDREQVVELCRGQQVVIHAAAESSIAKSYEELAPINVGGTENIIQGCLKQGVSRLVHISSTSVLFSGKDDLNIPDDRPLPEKYFCGYAESKAVAEQRVVAACKRGLNAFMIRARAVFGPGDNSLVPRVLRAYDEGRMRQIGDGKNISDMTHIDNLIYAVALAIERGESGGVCTVTGGQPVELWQVMRKILSATGRCKPLKSISFPMATRIAGVNETACRWLRLGEPSLTRYSVGLLAKSQTFSPEAAQKQLGYEPVVDQQVAIGETLFALEAKCDHNASEQVSLQLYSTGYTTHREVAAETGGKWRRQMTFHAMMGVITHPVHGVTLFDTGYAPRILDAAKNWPYSLYTKVTPIVCEQDESAIAIVNKLGLDANDVKRILISHFHGDHISGLADFPAADVISTSAAWRSIRAGDEYITGLKAVKNAFLPELMPDGIEKRIHHLERFHGPGIGPFERTHDLFHDGSVRLVELPGHATGQFGVLLQTGDRERVLLVADAVWTGKTIEKDLPLTRPFKWLAANAKAAKATRTKLVEFRRQYPDIKIVPTHCPAVALENKF